MKTGKHGSIIQIIMSVLLTHNSSDFFGPFPLPTNNLNKIRSDPNFGGLMTSLIESAVLPPFFSSLTLTKNIR